MCVRTSSSIDDNTVVGIIWILGTAEELMRRPGIEPGAHRNLNGNDGFYH